jgi:antitoxin MazE
MYIERKIRRVGNSLGLTLPSDMLKILQLNEDDIVRIYVEDDKLFIKKAEEKPPYKK